MTNPDPHLAADERYVSRNYASAYLDCSTSYIDNLIKSGALPTYKIGPRTVRVRLLDLQALVKPVTAETPA